MISLSLLTGITFWAPILGHLLALGFVYALYRRREIIGNRYPQLLAYLGLIILTFKTLYALSLSTIQYWIWRGDPIGSILLEMPLQKAGDFWFFEGKFGYFIFHVFERYWLELFFAIILGLVFYSFLVFLKKYRDRFFDIGETTLGGVLVFLSGWPLGLIFIALSFIIVVFLSSFRLMRQKGKLTTLGVPFLIAAALVVLGGDFVAGFSGLSVLKI